MASEYLLNDELRLRVHLYESNEMYREENIVRGGYFCTFTPRMPIAAERKEAHAAR
jgi:hypothetical protein